MNPTKFYMNMLIFVIVFDNCLTLRRILKDPYNIIEFQFEVWERKYHVKYPNEAARLAAFNNFRSRFMSVLRHQIKYYTYRSSFLMKLNKRACEANNTLLNGAKFTDVPPIEDNSVQAKAFNLPAYPVPPPSLDYRTKGLVTNVSDQGYSCASCYAFSAVCGIEGQVAKKYGRLRQLSAQNIVDCSSPYGNSGCAGGSIAISLRYTVRNPGIANATSYPYTGTYNTCSYNSSLRSEVPTSFTYVSGDENYVKSVLAAIGPLAVGMRGSLNSFYYYGSGIYDDPTCNTYIDHAVCIVGYGTDNTTSPPVDYWIIKNSWSTDWGENGYFRLKMGSNLCGISNYVVYPTV